MRRCVTCAKIIWPWQRQGWRVRKNGSLTSRWHAPRCIPWWAKLRDEQEESG